MEKCTRCSGCTIKKCPLCGKETSVIYTWYKPELPGEKTKDRCPVCVDGYELSMGMWIDTGH